MKVSKADYSKFKQIKLAGRYITHEMISSLIEELPEFVSSDIIGTSVLEKSIYRLSFGKGPIKIMMWSQMHGNESTTTRAVFDLINFIERNRSYLEEFSFLIIPMLNPDGAEVYTRVNANKVDLNRDAQDQSQPESRVLMKAFNGFKPDICLNLHGQRSIFAAGKTGRPATLSFLAPAQDENRSLTPNRIKAMALISGIYEDLKKDLPNAIGLYDDAFNLNCTGDTFQSLGVPTILYEAGHFPNDYQREETRYYVFGALLSLLGQLSANLLGDSKIYNAIPLNEKSYLDVIIRNVSIGHEDLVDIGIQYEENLKAGVLKFNPKVHKIGSLDEYMAHLEINARNSEVVFSKSKPIEEGDEIDFVIVNNEKILIKP